MLDKVMNGVAKILRNLAGIALMGVVFSVAYQVICRNILHIPCAWTEEVARYLMIWMTFLGAPVALKKGEHLMVDLFYNMYPAKVRQWVHLFCDIVVAAFCVYMLVFGIEMCTDPRLLRFKSPSAGIPRVYIYTALPIGAFFMLAVSIYDVWNTIKIIRGKAEDTTAANMVDESMSLEEIDRMKEEANK